MSEETCNDRAECKQKDKSSHIPGTGSSKKVRRAPYPG